MHVFNLAILLLMIKLCCIHGKSFLQYSLPVLMDPPHFATSRCTVYYDKLIEAVVKKFLNENLKIPQTNVDEIRFERVHRLPTRRSNKPRPIIARFSFFQDKEFVWSFIKNLKGSNIAIANDYPKEIENIHKTLYPVLKKAKQEKNAAFFKVDRLIINGQIYKGNETINLPFYGLIM